MQAVRIHHPQQGGESQTLFGHDGYPPVVPSGYSEPAGVTPATKEPPKSKHFFMSATLDNTRINRDVSKLVEEVISHLTALDGSKVEISLEVSATFKAVCLHLPSELSRKTAAH